MKAAIAAQWGPGEDWKAVEGVAEPAAGGRIEVVFLHDKAGALGHGPRTSAERERDLAQMLAPHTRKDMLVAAICETDWDPERWYPSVEAREKAEAEDGKWPSEQALARLAATSQYIKQAPRGCYVVSSRLRKPFYALLAPSFEDLGDLAADVALETSLRVAGALALADTASDVRLHGGIEPHPDQGDRVHGP